MNASAKGPVLKLAYRIDSCLSLFERKYDSPLSGVVPCQQKGNRANLFSLT